MIKSVNVYSLPVDMKYIRPMTDDILDLNTHTGNLKHAIDYICDEGTPIRAAGSGVVVWVKDDSNVGGIDRKTFWDLGNRVVIKHDNREYSAYEHLRFRGGYCIQRRSCARRNLNNRI